MNREVLGLQSVTIKEHASLRKGSVLSIWCKTSSHSSYAFC